MPTPTKALETKEVDGSLYWTPFSRFTARETELLQAWEAHYDRLGIPCHVCQERKLWVDMTADVTSYPRRLGLTV